MPRPRPSRLRHIHGIGVDRMGSLADSSGPTTDKTDLLRLENLDINVPPDPIVASITSTSAADDDDNSYLPFAGQLGLRNAAATHVSAMTGGMVTYDGERNCVITAGGLSGILNVLLATVEVEDGVVVTDPTYVGLLNRVRLVGGVPVFVPFKFESGREWRLDLDVLRKVVEDPARNVKAMLLMSPSLPTGAVLSRREWKVVADLCVKRDLLLIYDAAFERLVFDGNEVVSPAGLEGMAERTVTVGSASKELRMIGWRVGWVVGPEEMMDDISKVGMANVVVPVGIGQKAAAKALEGSRQTIGDWTSELQRRRNIIVEELHGLQFGIPNGGLSMLLRVDDYGMSGEEASKKLLGEGVCVTAMIGWGEEHGAQYVRLVFSNESVERLKGLGQKVKRALGSS